MFIRLKAFVDSSGTTWANETEELRTKLPDKFEVANENDPKYSAEFRGTCARVHDDTKLFVEMTNADDLANVTSCKFPENPYCQYEKERLAFNDSLGIILVFVWSLQSKRS